VPAVSNVFNFLYFSLKNSENTKIPILPFNLVVLLNSVITIPVLLIPSGLNTISLLCFFPISIGNWMIEYSKTCIQAKKQFFKIALINFVRSISYLCAIVCFASLEIVPGYSVAVVGLMISVLLGLAICVEHWFKKELVLIDREAIKSLRIIFSKTLLYVSLYQICLSVLAQVDVLLLNHFGTPHDLAIYGIAFRFYSIFLSFLVAVQTIQMPSIQHLKGCNDWIKYKNENQRIFYLALITVGCSIPALSYILPKLFGSQSTQVMPSLTVLLFSTLSSFKFSYSALALIQCGYESYMVKIGLISLVLNCIFDSILIPIAGALGASFGYLLTFLIINYLSYLKAEKEIFRISK
jgi:O-antigen/teichoic acid export membrane protein